LFDIVVFLYSQNDVVKLANTTDEATELFNTVMCIRSRTMLLLISELRTIYFANCNTNNLHVDFRLSICNLEQGLTVAVYSRSSSLSSSLA